MTFFPSEELYSAIRGLIEGLNARGAGDPAKILLEGFHCVAGAAGWPLFLAAIVTVRTLYDSQLLEEERRILQKIQDAVSAAAALP